jgi:hypothetical protein
MGKLLPALTLLVSLYEFYKSLPKRIRTSYDPHCINLITIVVRYLHRPQSLSKGGEENEKKFFVGAMISQPLIYIDSNCTALCPTKGLRRRHVRYVARIYHRLSIYQHQSIPTLVLLFCRIRLWNMNTRVRKLRIQIKRLWIKLNQSGRDNWQ